MDSSEIQQIYDIPGTPQTMQAPEPPTAPPVVPPEASTADVPPNTYLNLTDERREWLVTRACNRIDECRTKMGLTFGHGIARTGSWAWDRQVAQMQYDGVFEWRRNIGGIFLENNWSMNVPKRFIRLMAAKVCADLLGTEPYFATMPEKAQDAELSKAVEKYMQKEVGDSNLSECLREAVRVAITCGERPVKVSHVTDITYFKGPAVVAVDQQNQPIQTPGGHHIYPKDDFVPEPTNNQVRLKKDPSYVLGEGHPHLNPSTNKLNYKHVPMLPQKLVHKDGLEAGGISCEDFIYPIDVSSLDKADIMVHVYDDTLEALQQVWGDKSQNPRFSISATGPLSKASQPIEQQGEQKGQNFDREMVNVHEVYIRCDADDDGMDEWIFMVLDFKSRESIYEEYLGNMKMKEPPFKLIRGVESVPGRAYGNGVYKMFEHKNLFIDVQFNRVALKSSKEGSITFVHRDGTEESKAGIELVVGDKGSYIIPANSIYSKDKPPVFRVNLNEVDDFAVELMEKMIQQGMLEFGIVSAADGSESDLNASGTATGIRNIERTGNLLHRMTEDMVAKDIESLLDIATDIVLENMDPNTQQYSDDEQQLVTLNRDEIRTLPRDVRLLLTKVRSEEAIQTSTQVTALLDAYYARPLWLREKVRPEYINQLKMLEVQDADERLEKPTPEELQQEQQSLAAAKTTPPIENITAALKDIMALPPQISAQFLDKFFGIQVDPNTLQQSSPPPAQPPQTPPGLHEPHIQTPPSLQPPDNMQQPSKQ